MNYQLPNFNKAHVLVIGDVMLDRYWFGDTHRISPEAPVPIVNIQQTTDRLGGAGNVALNVAALGAQITLIGIAGDDAAGKTIQACLATASIHDAMTICPTLSTITKLRVMSHQQQLIRLDFETPYMADKTHALIASFKTQLQQCNLVILSDYNKGTLYHAQTFIHLAQQAGIPVIVDPKTTDFEKYRGADIITPNLKEFEALVGICTTEQELVQRGQQLLKSYDIKALLLTRGARGMTLIRGDTEDLHLPAHAREVFDVTGAGDTVIASLGAALAAQSPIEQAMAIANQAASLVVGKLGAATVSTHELQTAHATSLAFNQGIIDENQLRLACSQAKQLGKKIVFTNGCFDILHAGHITYLKQAKQLGDYLVVAINDDASVVRLNKGPGRPINPLQHRLTVLASLHMVDWVIPFTDDTPERLLQILQPDILVKGGDYQEHQVVGAPIVRAYGGEVRVLGLIKNLSTTRILARAIETHHAK